MGFIKNIHTFKFFTTVIYFLVYILDISVINKEELKVKHIIFFVILPAENKNGWIYLPIARELLIEEF